MKGLSKAIILGLVLTGGVVAQAGQKLLLKSGTLDTKEGSQNQVFMSATTEKTNYQIVQFKGPITLNDQNWLKSLNIEILRYIPDDAYVVRLESLKSLKALHQSELLQAVVPYQAEFRLNTEALALSVFNENQNGQIHIRVFKSADLDQVKKELLAIRGLEIIDQEGGAFIVSVPMGLAKNLARIEGVEWVDAYREHQIQNFDARKAFKTMEDPFVTHVLESGQLSDLTGFETGTRIMKFSAAWGKGLTGKGQTVAVADTGLDTGDLGTLDADFSGLVKPYIGGIHSTTWGDPDGHGTHVAGSILNSGKRTNGKIKGGAYESGLIFESMHSEAYGSITIGPDPSPLFQVAYDDGARIHSNSWGSIVDHGAYDDSARSVDEFMFQNQDMLILFSAGNEGVDANQDGRVDKGSVTSPSTAKNALTVGASENLVHVGGVQIELGLAGSEEAGFRWPAEPIASDKLSNSENGLAAFSSRGPTKDGRLKPDVVAPGTNILSNCSHYENAGKLWGPFNKDFCYSGGTSMSTPLVAAAAALVRQNLAEKRNTPNPNASLVKAILMHTAFDMYPGQYGEVGKELGQELLKPGPNIDQGFGRVDVSKAVGADVKFLDEKVGLATGEKKELKLTPGVRKVTLVYTDAPGSTAAQKALVNDLNLEVHTATGAFFSSRSSINNSEQIVIPASAIVTKLVVKARNVPMGINGKQPFSVVYSH